MASEFNILHAYRHLYRGLLQAVQYARPARYVARDALRAAFREPDQKGSQGSAIDEEGVKRTLVFLKLAAKERGLEHRLVKNLLEARRLRGSGRGWKRVVFESKMRPDVMTEHQRTAWRHYDMTVAMLNESMGLCLR